MEGHFNLVSWPYRIVAGRQIVLNDAVNNIIHAACSEPETMRHLLIECPFSKQVWHKVLPWLRMTCRPPSNADTSLIDWLVALKPATPKPSRKGLGTTALLMTWMFWKHRNACVFEGARPSFSNIMTTIKDEAAHWAQTAALGLSAPTTWSFFFSML
jgi:hypothetical protein|nr:uncharacterized protein LOC127315200 [Lolium perenne]